MATLVSIITPTFNRSNLLQETIASALAQTYKEFELIIIDDGSVDDTARVISDFSDSRIRYVYQDNRGQSAARNKGLALASGEMVAFLDSDDTWLPHRLERHVSLLQENARFDAVYGMAVIRGKSVPPGPVPKILPSGNITKSLLRQNFISFSSVLLRMKLVRKLGGFDESLRSAEDYDYWLRASVHGEFLADPVISEYYRKTPGSVSSLIDKNFEANEMILRRFFSNHPEYASIFQKSLTWGLFYQDVSRQLSGVRRHGDAIRSALRAIAYAPWHPLGYAALARRLLNAVRRPA